MATGNPKTAVVPADLKCTECKSVLRNACQLLCGCRFCRDCVDDLMVSGIQFCPGDSRECGRTSLLTAQPDYNANKMSSRLTSNCPELQTEMIAPEERKDHLRQGTSSSNRNNNETVADDSRDLAVPEPDVVMQDEQMRAIMDDLKHVHGNMKNDIRSIKRDMRAIRVNIDSMQTQLETRRVHEPLRPADARFDDWPVNDDVSKVDWDHDNSDNFTGTAHRYTYYLSSGNRLDTRELWIWLHILAGPHDSRLAWPFKGVCAITVAQRARRDARMKLTLQTSICRPTENQNRCSSRFKFWHSQLEGAGIDLSGDMCVSCEIFPDPPCEDVPHWRQPRKRN